MCEIRLEWYDAAQTVMIWEFPMDYVTTDLYAAWPVFNDMLMRSGRRRMDIIMVLDGVERKQYDNLFINLGGLFAFPPGRLGSIILVDAEAFSPQAIYRLQKLQPTLAEMTLFAHSFREAVDLVGDVRRAVRRPGTTSPLPDRVPA